MSTVLVVEDNPTLQATIARVLSKSGLNVIQASDGIEAMEKIQVERPDLVVMDIVMPRMNGYELCRWIKNNPIARHMPVVICSTKNEEFDRYWGMKQGIDAYITRPFQPAEMVETVKQLLRKPERPA